jgi:alpha-tubulin suppressor-like RCC1 family protein
LIDSGTDWSAIAAGSFYSCGLRRSQDLLCWGLGSSGQLGTGNNERVMLPQRIVSNTKWIQVGLGAAHSCAIDVHRQVYCWGGNDSGQLGTGDTETRSLPTRIQL